MADERVIKARVAAEHPDRVPPALHCLACSDDLTSLATGICPKCGRTFDRDDPSTFDTRTRTQRLLIRIAASLAISALCVGTMVAGASIASGLEFSSFHAAVLAYVSVGAACALVTAIAAIAYGRRSPIRPTRPSPTAGPSWAPYSSGGCPPAYGGS